MRFTSFVAPGGRGILVCAALFLLVAGSLSLWGYTVDDAWITYRYARNAAAGWGLVYNEGQRVEGFTSPLWFLAALGAESLRIAPDQASKALSLLAVAGFVVFAGRRIGDRSKAAMLPLVLLAIHVPLLVAIVSGLEMAFGAVCIGALLILADETRLRWRLVAFIGVLAILARPENLLLVGVLGGVLWFTRPADRRNLVRVGCAWLGIVALLTLGRWWYFGQVVPNTALAKVRPDGGAAGMAWNYLRSWGMQYGWLALLALPAMTQRGTQRMAGMAAALIAAQVAFIFVAGGDWMPGWRFALPIGVVLVVLGCAGLDEWSRAEGAAWPGRKTAGRWMAAACIAAIAAEAGMLRFDRWRIDYEARQQEALVRGPVDFVAARASAGDCVAARDVGALGYRAGCVVLDLVGLTDPTIAACSGFRHRERINRDYVFGRRPEFILLQSEKPEDGPPELDRIARELVKDARMGGYALVRRFELPGRHFCEVYRRASETMAAR